MDNTQTQSLTDINLTKHNQLVAQNAGELSLDVYILGFFAPPSTIGSLPSCLSVSDVSDTDSLASRESHFDLVLITPFSDKLF